MRKFFAICLVLLSIASLVSYAIWTGQRPAGHYLSDLRIRLAINEGQPGERGNLLGIEPELFPTDYQNIERLHRKLAAYLQQARENGLINPRTVVVLPEHIGTWLFASGEKDQLYQAATLDEAMDWLSWSNPLQFIKAVLRAEGRDRLDDAHLRIKARSMAQDYQTLFGGLAREFGVTLVAGSIVLPDPSVEGGQLKVGSGALYNSSLTFGSDGLPLGQPQRQLYAERYQRRYVHTASDAPLYVVDTPAGRLGVLIGSDSWYPENYARLNQSGAQLIAVPAFVIGKAAWSQPWRKPRHSDIDVPNETPSEGDAWHHLTLTGRAPQSTAQAGISVFMRGQFWNQGVAGQSFASHAGQTIAEPQQENAATGGARLINLWL
ncbi:carbon-nitrogen hydrolase family protein [Pseudomonas syringae]|uniref:Carbon-nitrogen hydrolase family protein n=1 Tax=Pseudomonas syringae pv. papulans TaxID=83963 RepID=A0A3M3MLV3_PSESX|nr:carbon-nitrogen hydrolase family protein [Pseudomonas syringae]KWS34976.1 carbon-nitrogen hydrolase [Pseudomonas syringae pv. papulans]MDH4601950.1 carbon-nitrogen hydrolase family protein [Pseudomonas syringae pv. papulans]MDH4624033.1 carbon-nitrogen hydrolase family protein [Pseudomonas syringae pv. papulans]RMN48434.1 Nitrilase/cyanide hydratase and apolipoprotein N-acyltransferase [Pseudomonas syringae pv. papulans]RMV47654.1 Nitrilase/cyanide hydratase and apolipoprotein N-acyltransfe